MIPAAHLKHAYLYFSDIALFLIIETRMLQKDEKHSLIFQTIYEFHKHVM